MRECVESDAVRMCGMADCADEQLILRTIGERFSLVLAILQYD